ncbi:MAG: phage tail tape measure C-terminal domain-containing protein, partial [archaeon]
KEAREALKKFGWGLDKAGDKADKFSTKLKELKYELENMEREGEYDRELARIEQRYASEQRMFLETYHLKKDNLEEEKNRAKAHYEEIKNSVEATEIDKLRAEKNYREKKQEYDQYLLENAKEVTEKIANMNLSGATKSGDAWKDAAKEAGAFMDVISIAADDAFAEISSDVNDWTGNFKEVFVNAFNEMSTVMTDFLVEGKGEWKDFARSVLRMIQEMIVKFWMLKALQAIPGMGSYASALVQHKGGVVGETPSPIRIVPKDFFDKAKKFHDGLMPDEFPAILQKGERVVSKSDTTEEKTLLQEINRKMDNQQSGSNTQEKGMRIVNVLDPNLFDDWATSSSGEKVLKNFIKRNSSFINQVVK